MGSVRMGTDLVRQIKANATAPFTKTINEELTRFGNDPKLIRMIRLQFANGNTTIVDAIEAIESQPDANKWFGYWQSTSTLIPGGHCISFNGAIKDQHSFAWENAGRDAQQYIEANRKLLDRAATDRDNVTGLIDTIAEECTTLKQAEKVLPSILDWVPQEVLAKHRAPPTKARPKLDTDAVRASVLSQEAVSAINRARIK